ncbi:MAG: PAS domain-containing protein [Acidobacteriales bacterium]|nr:PAS domain-containing protein [Terriglobales bacterium]
MAFDPGAANEVAIYAPTGRDGRLISQLLARHAVSSQVCGTLLAVVEAIDKGVGVVLLAEESLTPAAIEQLSRVLKAQPPWSDVPVIVLTGGGDPSHASQQLAAMREPLGNLALLERPVRTVTLVSSIQTALRARRRQYEIRDYLLERKKTEDELRQSRDEFRQLANAMPQLVWVAEANGEVYWYNDRWFEYTGTTPEQMAGTGWKVVHDPAVLPTVMERWTASLKSGDPFEMEFPIRGADGVFRWFLTRVNPILSADHRVLRWLGTNTNVDEQRSARQALSAAQQRLEGAVRERTAELDAANRNLRELTARVLRLRDEERRRIARELHDSLGQMVVALGMNLAVVEGEIPNLTPKAADAVRQNQGFVQEISAQIRTISHLLHPPLLDEIGLSSALEWFVQGFAERSKIEVKLEIPSDFGRLPQDVETALFRVVQESLTNIHRHANSRTAQIAIQRSGEKVVREICDTGDGIPGEKLRRLSTSGVAGVGLQGMRERLRQLGGSLKVASGAKGTTVKAEIPLEAQAAASW